MPNYKDGSEAKIGDRVRGVGYNVREADGTTPKVIVGTVIGLVQDKPTCNIRVAHVMHEELPAEFKHPPHRLFAPTGVINQENTDGKLAYCGAWVEVEYGETRCFEKIA